MKVLDLFSGIGGFSLGLERAGMETVAFCEIEPYPRKILAKHWPNVLIYEDVRDVTAERLRSDGLFWGDSTPAAKAEIVAKPEGVRYRARRETGNIFGKDGRQDSELSSKPCGTGIDVITGGFPCQDISVAGKQAGIGEGTRSGLWSECARLLREVRPRYAIFENVTALLSGQRGAWFQRVLFDISEVGYDAEWHCIPASELGAHHHRDRVWIIAYPNCKRGCSRDSKWENAVNAGQPLVYSRFNARRMESWDFEPNVGRVANGIPRRVDRLKGLGNAVVPQIPEIIGRAIMQIEKASTDQWGK